MPDKATVVGVGWYGRESWTGLRDVASDPEKLDDSYEVWFAGAKKALRELILAGMDAQRIVVDVEDLAEWCNGKGRPIDSAARAAYVADRVRPAMQKKQIGGRIGRTDQSSVLRR